MFENHEIYPQFPRSCTNTLDGYPVSGSGLFLGNDKMEYVRSLNSISSPPAKVKLRAFLRSTAPGAF